MWKHASTVASMRASICSLRVEPASSCVRAASTLSLRCFISSREANPGLILCKGGVSGAHLVRECGLPELRRSLLARRWQSGSGSGKHWRGDNVSLVKPGVRMLSTITGAPGAGRPSEPAQEDNREVMVQHILLPEDQLQTLLKLQTRIIQEDIDLSDLATEFSICPSKKEGGMLGWIARGETVPEFEQAAFSAPIDKLVRVQTKYGWHLLQVVAEREAIRVHQLSVEELGERLDQLKESGDLEEFQLMDVREPSEAEVARIPGFKLYPLSKFGEWAPTIDTELNPLVDTIVLCHHGIRSQQAANWLKSQGFSRLFNVSGGIDAYSRKVDSSIPRY